MKAAPRWGVRGGGGEVVLGVDGGVVLEVEGGGGGVGWGGMGMDVWGAGLHCTVVFD